MPNNLRNRGMTNSELQFVISRSEYHHRNESSDRRVVRVHNTLLNNVLELDERSKRCLDKKIMLAFLSTYIILLSISN